MKLNRGLLLLVSGLILTGLIGYFVKKKQKSTQQCRFVKVDYNLKKHEINIKIMAKKLLDYLQHHVERTAIIARAGFDMSDRQFRQPIKQKYSHAGFIWKDGRDNQWYVKHMLNICNGPSSKISIESLEEFFDDDPYFYDFRIIVPSEELQVKMANVLESKHSTTSLHNPRYSKISNPLSTDYQNSNEWVISVIAAAQSGLTTLGSVQKFYRENEYLPSRVFISGIEQFGIPFMYDNITLEDHPQSKGHEELWIQFSSAASIFHYIEKTDTPLGQREICHEQGCNLPLDILNM